MCLQAQQATWIGRSACAIDISGIGTCLLLLLWWALLWSEEPTESLAFVLIMCLTMAYAIWLGVHAAACAHMARYASAVQKGLPDRGALLHDVNNPSAVLLPA